MNVPPELSEAALAFVKTGLDLLRPTLSAPPGEPFIRSPFWVLESPGAYVQRTTDVPLTFVIVARQGTQLTALGEYTSFAQALRAQPEIREQLDAVLVGAPSVGATRIDPTQIAFSLLSRIIDRVHQGEIDEEIVREEIDRVYSYLRRTEIEQIILAPLFGLKVASPPLQIDARLELDKFSDAEVIRCLNGNLFPSPLVMWGTANLGEVFGVRAHRILQKMILRADQHVDLAPNELEDKNFYETTGEVLHALKIFKSGRVVSAGSLSFAEGGGTLISHALVSRRLILLARHTGYNIEVEEASDLQSFWKKYRDAKGRPFLQVAIRRFGLAGDRDNIEDKLIDLMIAAESLFLTDDSQELAHRLSERCAFYLTGRHSYSRRQLFDTIKRAYDVRSKIVHGKVPKTEIQLPEKGKVSLETFVEVIEELIRLTLHNAILSAATPKKALEDWNKLILGN